MIKFLELLSIHDQVRLLNQGYMNLIESGEYGKVLIKTGTKYYKIILNDSITCNIDKKTFLVYDFYKHYVGSVESMTENYEKNISRFKKQGNFEPKVSYHRVKVPPKKGYLGKIFYNSWGYDQTNNDFVQVVKETDKQVRVVKVKKDQHRPKDAFMSGSEVPLPGKFNSKEFVLVKELYRGEIVLRGIDKSGSGSSQSATWDQWKGEPIGFSEYA